MHAKNMFKIYYFLNHCLTLVFITSRCHPALEWKETQKTLWNKYGRQIEVSAHGFQVPKLHQNARRMSDDRLGWAVNSMPV